MKVTILCGHPGMSSASSSDDDELPVVVAELGKGTYGRVVRATFRGVEFAIKIESPNAKSPQLHREYRMLRFLKHCPHVPQVFRLWEPPSGELWMAMALLGTDLEAYRPSVDRVVSEIAPTFIRTLRSVHDAGILHRDIKPANMMRGCKGASLWLVDFGLAKRYVRDDGTHIPFRRDKSITGTPRFLSLHAHAGCESARRDDMISLGYAIVLLAKGKLPWSKVEGDTIARRVHNMAKIKRTTSVETLCAGLPPAFRFYFTSINTLAFDERPDYELLLSYFH